MNTQAEEVDLTEVEEVVESAEPQDGEESEDGEIEVSIGDEESTASEDESEEQHEAPQWVKDLRKTNKELKRQLREKDAQLQTVKPKEPEKPKLPPKPKLADSDYDEDKHQEKMDAWYEAKRKFDDDEKAREEARKAEEAERNKVHDTYKAESQSLKVKDFSEAEEEVEGALSPAQQGLLLSAANKPALLVYALGKNPKKLEELAAIKNPAKFAAAVGVIEKDLKVKPRNAKPQPETVVRGSAPKSAGVGNSALERLRSEAARTGNFTKLHAFKRQQAEAARKR